MKLNTIYNGDCLKVMDIIPNESIDMILCDLPYGSTRNKWDTIIPLDEMWKQYIRILKFNGVVVLTATAKFAAQLIMSQPVLFKYDLIWEKTISSGQLNVNKQPLRNHEQILIFYQHPPTYNQQYIKGSPYSINRKANYIDGCYNEQRASQKVNNGFRHPKSVIKVSNPRIKGGIPTQKPVPLFEYLIETYTNKDDIVLDNCIGSGTTGIACQNTGRNFIGIELNEEYAKIAANRCLVELETFKCDKVIGEHGQTRFQTE